MHDYPAIMEAILADYALPVRGHHGVVHWARVTSNGLRLAEANGADAEVVQLFAIFHDSRRVNERIDQGHGQRGGDFARTLRGSLVHLDDARFDLLYEACRLHTDGQTEADPTIQACWDADRLDLGRVGITPHKRFLCTEAARGMVYWAHNRAVTRHAPADVLTSWGLHPDLPTLQHSYECWSVIPITKRFWISGKDTMTGEEASAGVPARDTMAALTPARKPPKRPPARAGLNGPP